MSDHSNKWKQAAISLGSGASAGFIEVCLMHPLDLIKTRMQLQSKVVLVETAGAGQLSQIYYEGIGDCFRKMYRHEGFFSFWKGILPPILAETPKRAVKFFTFEEYKGLFMSAFGTTTATPLIFSLAGAGAGITEAILVNPFEVVKVSLQSDRSRLKELPSTWSVTRQIARTQGLGLSGLNKGLSGTVARNGIFNMIYFGFYNSVKDYVPVVQNDVGEFARKLGIGFASGTLASCANIPFDVAKSRMQGPQPVPGQIKYKTLFGSLRLIYVEEGWRALFKGLVPKVMRLGPGGAIMQVAYEYCHRFLTEQFPD